MKKSLIAQSVAALIGGLGLAGAANAAVFQAEAVAGVNPADILVVNTDGIGHINLVPYYSTQNGNDTYINITNTDTKNGKAVKVRFRAAGNSDDVYDITVLMSPGDVWAAAVTKDATSGLPKLNHNDKTCTLPGNVKGTFVTTRLDPGLTAAQKAEQASEGYVEILNMADIPQKIGTSTSVNALWTAIKHVSGVAPCTQSTLDKLFSDATSIADARSKGLEVPTTGLMTNWTVINVPKAAAYTGAATAVEARVGATGPAGTGNYVLFPQAATSVSKTLINRFTSDPLLRNDGDGVNPPTTNARILASNFDLPDLSTPYLAGTEALAQNGPIVQASFLSRSLAVTSVTNEFVTDPGLLAKTDWVFSMPTRRYSVAFDYKADPGSEAVFTVLAPFEFFTATNVSVSGRQLCVKDIATAAAIDPALVTDGVNRSGATTANREEGFLSSPTEFVISPGDPVAPLTFCGEVSILTFNAGTGTSALGAKVARKDLTLPYTDGWMRMSTPGLINGGLPIIGTMMTELFNSAATAGVAGAYGQTFPHRMTRPLP